MARCPAHGNRIQLNPSRAVNLFGATPQPDCRRTQELEGAAIHRLIELEVDCPDVMRVFRAQQLPATSSRPGALAPARQGPLETFLTPDPLHSLVIDAPAIQS